MTLETALHSIGINPVTATKGMTFAKNGRFYQVTAFIGEQRGFKLFRALRDGKFVMLAEEQLRVIFA